MSKFSYKCPKCGNHNSIVSNKCRHCGAFVKHLGDYLLDLIVYGIIFGFGGFGIFFCWARIYDSHIGDLGLPTPNDIYADTAIAIVGLIVFPIAIYGSIRKWNQKKSEDQ